VKAKSALSETEQLKLKYNDLINGYSFYKDKQIYVKHFCEQSYAKILQAKADLIQNYVDQGLPFIEDREKEAIQQGSWTQEKNDRILQLKYILSDNEKYAQSLVIESQRKMILDILKKDKKELENLLQEKDDALGPTCEKFAERSIDSYFIYELFYKNESLNCKYFDFQEFDLLDYEELIIYKKILNYCLSIVQDDDIRKIAAMPFFLNSFSLVKDRPERFFNKSIILLTFNQHNLLSSGLRNLNILSQVEGSPPSLIDCSVNDLLNWYDQQYSVMIGKNKGQSSINGINVTSRDIVK